ncbi:MAG: metallophosphoesterase [Bacteroidetes bacterium HGW-Bacteroidetes-1]|nr:MAG: metallophosphoesterase [Bacteroidetes bacterium HGW-Bacteroidetes-1]
MRSLMFIIFFSIVLTVYSLVNYYIFSRGLRTFEAGSHLRLIYIIGFWLLAVSFVVGRVLEKVYLSQLSDFFTWTGSFWLAAMLYLFLSVFLIDMLRLINHFLPFFEFFQSFEIFRKPYLFTIAIASFVFLLVLAGHINAVHPTVTKVNIDTQVVTSDKKTLRIVMASDIHLGTIISTRRITKIVNKINSLKPDAVLLAGDIVDEDLAPVIRQNLGAILEKINAPLGVIGSTGNHEYIGGAEEAVAYLTSHNINILRDTMIQLTESVYVAGREDIESLRFGGNKRKALADIIADLPSDKFLIVLDHQPRAITEAVEAKANLVLSGHTHHGQMWPLNFITSAAFPVSWGHKLFGDTHVYVSSGVGSWGPPVRIGNRPEIVEITINFTDGKTSGINKKD